MIGVFETWHYRTTSGKDPFDDWLSSQKDKDAAGRIAARINRLEAGNFGDCRSVGKGIWELRIDHGPDYQVYYVPAGRKAVLLLCGGDKRAQAGDILLAKKYWADH
jgi:putative addiction module killer protein